MLDVGPPPGKLELLVLLCSIMTPVVCLFGDTTDEYIHDFTFKVEVDMIVAACTLISRYF